MRVLFILIVTAAGIIGSFFDAFYGLLLYAFYSLASPLELSWGALEGTRLSFMVAATVSGTALMQRQGIFINSRSTYFYVLFYLSCFASLAVRNDVLPVTWDHLWLFTRIMIMSLVTGALVNDLRKLRLYILAVAVFTGMLGAYYGFFGLMSGSTSIIGPGTADSSRFGDNNTYACWLNTSLPFIYYAAINLKDKRLKYLGFAVLLGNVIAVILTFSRGGFLTLLATIVLIFVTTKKKIFYVIIILVVFSGLFFLTPSSYTPRGEKTSVKKAQTAEEDVTTVDKTADMYQQRISTIKTYDTEESATGRMHFWKTAIAMANDNPVFGIGFFRYKYAFDYYDDSGGLYGSMRDVHNTYMEFLADTGYLGFSFFVILIINCLIDTNNLARRITVLYGPEEKEFLGYTRMIWTAFIAYFLGSTFVNAIFHDLFWNIVALSIAMGNIAKRIETEEIEVKTV